jgi:hypothetical protein
MGGRRPSARGFVARKPHITGLMLLRFDWNSGWEGAHIRMTPERVAGFRAIGRRSLPYPASVLIDPRRRDSKAAMSASWP